MRKKKKYQDELNDVNIMEPDDDDDDVHGDGKPLYQSKVNGCNQVKIKT